MLLYAWNRIVSSWMVCDFQMGDVPEWFNGADESDRASLSGVRIPSPTHSRIEIGLEVTYSAVLIVWHLFSEIF